MNIKTTTSSNTITNTLTKEQVLSLSQIEPEVLDRFISETLDIENSPYLESITRELYLIKKTMPKHPILSYEDLLLRLLQRIKSEGLDIELVPRLFSSFLNLFLCKPIAPLSYSDEAFKKIKGGLYQHVREPRLFRSFNEYIVKGAITFKDISDGQYKYFKGPLQNGLGSHLFLKEGVRPSQIPLYYLEIETVSVDWEGNDLENTIDVSDKHKEYQYVPKWEERDVIALKELYDLSRIPKGEYLEG